MFTDKPAIPTRVETLIDLLRIQPKRRWTESQVAELVQPESLAGVHSNSKQAGENLAALKELELVELGKDTIRLTFPSEDERDTKTILCEAMDEHVLGKLNIEPYFAPFYSFLLSIGAAADVNRTQEQWAVEFRGKYPLARESNPFNKDKCTALHRWYSYVGLGWWDQKEVFQCNPYFRLLRRLPKVFGKDKELPAVEFFSQVSSACPELDGGDIYHAVGAGVGLGERRCSLGLSRALIELHMDKLIRLHCPTDSDGWLIGDADPPRDGTYLRSDRVDRVSWLQPTVIRSGRVS